MRSRFGLLAVPLLLVSLLPGPVAAASPPPDAAAAHRANVLAYWTPERMRAAIPRDFVFDAVRGFQPVAKPGRPPADTTTGSSWNGGGKMLTATGRVLFTMDGTDWICSGSVVDDTNDAQAIVLTAGHCVFENGGTFATNWLFIPSFDTAPYYYDCPSTTYGCWVADELYADAAFASAGGFNDTAVQHDWGFAVVGPGDRDGSQLDTKVGSFPIQYDVDFAGQTLSAFGYPAAGRYHGYDLVYCRGVVGTDPYTSNTTWSMPCGMTGGSSGGPWVRSSNTATYADAVLGSLNSYGYSGLKYMFGPKFNADTEAVFTADRGTLSSGVVRAP